MMTETVANLLTVNRRAGRMPAMPTKPDDVLSSAELARHYGVSGQRVRQWVDAGCPYVAAGHDPFTGKPTRPYFRVADVDAWRAARPKAGRPKGSKSPEN